MKTLKIGLILTVVALSNVAFAQEEVIGFNPDAPNAYKMLIAKAEKTPVNAIKNDVAPRVIKKKKKIK